MTADRDAAPGKSGPAEEPDPVEAADPVEEADEESFPASDPPARTVITGVSDRPLDPADERLRNPAHD